MSARNPVPTVTSPSTPTSTTVQTISPQQLRTNALAGFASAAAAIRRFGTTVLISAGVVALLIGALLIWPAVVAIRQSKAIADGTVTYSVNGEPQKQKADVAIGVAIAGAVLGGLVLLGSVLGVAMGAVSVGIVGILISSALLIVGAIAAHRLLNKDKTTGQPFDNRGAWGHASAGLWIAAIVIGLILPGLASLIVGIWLSQL